MRLDAVYFIRKEKFQEMIRAAEQDHLLPQAKLHKPGQTGLNRKLAAWTGVRMVKWGAKLQQHGSVSAAASTSAAQSGRPTDAALP